MRYADQWSTMSLSNRTVASADDLVFRLINIEFEQAKHGPIFHLFGTLPDSTKVCAHIAGYLPYILVKLDPMSGQLDKDQLREMIDEWLFKCELKKEKASKFRYRQRYVHRIELVERFDVYGYHPKKEKFAKLYFLEAKHRRMANQLLSQCAEKAEAIFGTVFEAHFPPHLQFMADNCLFGMDRVTISLNSDKLAFRLPENVQEDATCFGSITVRCLRERQLISEQAKISTCAIELDAHVDAIFNSKLYENNSIPFFNDLHRNKFFAFSNNPGIETIWAEERERCADMRVSFVDSFREGIACRPPSSGIGLQVHEKEALHRVAEQRIGVVCSDSAPLQTQLLLLDPKEGTSHMEVDMNDEETRDCFGGLPLNEPDELDATMLHSQAYYESSDPKRVIENQILDLSQPPELMTSPDKSSRPEEQKHPNTHSDLPSCSHWEQPLVGIRRKRSHIALEKDSPTKNDAPDLDTTFIQEIVLSSSQSSASNGTITISDDEPEQTPAESPWNSTTYDIFNQSRPGSAFTSVSGSFGSQNSRFKDENEGVVGEIRGLSVSSIELIVDTSTVYPNPQNDAILGACICFYQSICTDYSRPDHAFCIAQLSEETLIPVNMEVINVRGDNTELQVLSKIAELVNRFDPDILVGYDVDRVSWGYLIDRGNRLYNLHRQPMSFYQSISRIENAFVDSKNLFDLEKREAAKNTEEERWFGRIAPPAPHGRMIFNAWRIVRKEDIRSYDRGTASLVFLKKKVPAHSTSLVGSWFKSRSRLLIRQACEYVLMLAINTVEILVEMDFFQKNAEMARVYGILFMEVKTRGSQYRVESMLLRLARTRDFALASVSQTARAWMKKPEFIQLIMEPEHGLYLEPVVVLDFQSLYPSMMIAYNLCYSTAMGKMSELIEGSQKIVFGGRHYSVPNDDLHALVESNNVHLSTSNALFASKATRVGLLPKMVEELLATRLIVKHSMKYAKDERTRRLLNARQLALKLVCNVTYGYTAANWSGRMPCVEVADAILSNGRATLENAIGLVREIDPTTRVIYGDTDSLFILCPGKSVNEAFTIGDKLAELVEKKSPAPVTLKVEKVYKGLALFSKKHYAGMKIEKPGGDMEFEAKGIETIRRDACLLTSKLVDETLRLLFMNATRADVDQAVAACVRSLPLRDFNDFALSRDYRPPYNIPCAQAAVGRQLSSTHYFRGPMWKERITFVVCRTNDPYKDPVWMGAKSMSAFTKNPNLLINHHYYARAHILGPLQRVYALKGWTINELPAIDSIQVTSHFFRAAILVDARRLLIAFTAQTRLITECRRACRQCFHRNEHANPSICSNFACPLYDTCRRDLKTIMGVTPVYREEWSAGWDGLKKVCRKEATHMKEMLDEVRDYIQILDGPL